MTRPATRLRDGLERIKGARSKGDPYGVADAGMALEADLALCEEGGEQRLLEALNDEYQRGRESAFREAAAAARQAAENTIRSDVAVGGIVSKVVEGFIALCESKAREASR